MADFDSPGWKKAEDAGTRIIIGRVRQQSADGVIEVHGKLSAAEREDLRDAFARANTGPQIRGPICIEDGSACVAPISAASLAAGWIDYNGKPLPLDFWDQNPPAPPGFIDRREDGRQPSRRIGLGKP